MKPYLTAIMLAFTVLAAGCKHKKSNNYQYMFIHYGHLCDSLTWTLKSKDTLQARMYLDSAEKYYSLMYPKP